MSINDIDVKKVKEELTTKISAAFYQIFAKQLKKTLTVDETDKMNKSLKAVVGELFKAVELKAVDLSVRLAESTDEAFEKVSKKIDAAEAQIKDIRQDFTVVTKVQNEATSLEQQVKELQKEVEALKQKVNKPEDPIREIYS
jgi:uncharacterized protein involved in exopolysaccharide biosynthesis